MNDDIQKLQADLRGLQPPVLDPAFLDRLEMAVHGELDQLGPELKATEQLLAAQQPAGVPEEFAGQLVAVARKTPFPVGKKVVLFPGESSAKPKSRSRFSWMASAACVALAGALAAFFVNPAATRPVVASVPSEAGSAVPSKAVERGAFVPASFNSGVSDTSDLGVMWAERSRPLRVVKVTYRDQVKLLNEQGEEVVVEVPRVEFLVVPEKVD